MLASLGRLKALEKDAAQHTDVAPLLAPLVASRCAS
jgi:hypothetical protein